MENGKPIVEKKIAEFVEIIQLNRDKWNFVYIYTWKVQILNADNRTTQLSTYSLSMMNVYHYLILNRTARIYNPHRFSIINIDIRSSKRMY